MQNSKFYVVTQVFSLNLDNGKNTVNLNKGDIIEFDGLNAECKGIKGQAGVLRSVIKEGEWIRPIAQEKIAEFQAKLMAKLSGRSIPSSSKNMTAGKVVENSSVEAEVKRARKDDLDTLVSEYEEKTFTPKQANVSASNPKKLEGNNDVRRRVVDNYDDQEVAKVRAEASPTRNTSGVEIGKTDVKKSVVVSEEDRVAKETNYSRKVEASEPSPREVDMDGDGVVVKKTRVPAVTKTEITDKNASSISKEEDSVIDTNYNDLDTHTDIGSSTQAGVVQQSGKNAKKAAASKPKYGARIITGDPVEDQGATVVGKVKKTATLGTSEGGIVSKVSVGSPKEDMGEVTFSAVKEGIDISDEATFSSSDIPVTDIMDMGDGVEVINADANEKTTGSIDIDISDLLDE